VPTPAETLPIGLEARQRISALYQMHALALVKLAVLMTGDQSTAEDVVQDAFLGLYRRWRSLQDADKALGYLRTSVLNGCRSVHRTRFRRQGITLDPPADTASAEDTAMLGAANREVLAAIRRLPIRQREAVDGKTAICATQYSFLGAQGTNAGCADGGLKFTAYSVHTGKPVRVLYQYRGSCHNGESTVLWTDASATKIIGATEINVADEGGKQAAQLGVIADGNLRPLKISTSVSPADYGGIAF
jgi:RNA polymerase sigma factor (sigma-70 family)